MGLLKKRGDVLDLSALQKSGLLQRSRAIAEKDKKLNSNGDKIVDFTAMQKTLSIEQNNSSNNSSNEGAFGFLNSFASMGATNESKVPETFNQGNLGNSNLEVTGLRNKIEDLEYKIASLIERLERVEGKIN